VIDPLDEAPKGIAEGCSATKQPRRLRVGASWSAKHGGLPTAAKACNIICGIVLVITDGLVLTLAIWLATMLRDTLAQSIPQIGSAEGFGVMHYLRAWWLIPVWLSVHAFEGLYNHRYTLWDEIRTLWKAGTVAAFALFGLVGLGRMSAGVERSTVAILWGSSLILMPLLRTSVKRLFRVIHLWEKDVLVIGAGETGVRVARAVARDLVLGYRVVAFVDDDQSRLKRPIWLSRVRPVPVLGKVSDAAELLRKGVARDVILAIPSLPEEKVVELVNELQPHAETIRVVPRLSSMPMMDMRIDRFLRDQLFMLSVGNSLAKPWNRWFKRGIDLVLGGVGALLMLPVLGLVSVLVKLDSPGPVLYVHDRIGRYGKTFRCLKFRSMYVDGDSKLADFFDRNPGARNEWDKYKKLKSSDPRVTSVGHMLRRWSIDEFPQLFNVLKGDMSLVGARPYLPREWEDMGLLRDTVLATKPGMTGLWQVSGKNDIPFDERVKLEAWYTRNWSLWLDLTIMIRTVRTVLMREGAY